MPEPSQVLSEPLRRLLEGKHPSSMVDKPGPLLKWLFAWLLSSVAFNKRTVDALRDAELRGTVVYVTTSRSIIDYFYFNLAYLREGLKLVRFAPGMRTWGLRRPLAALTAFFRGRRGLPSDADCLELLVAGDQPALLFLEANNQPDPELPVLIERIVQHARLIDRPVWLVPQLLIWDKRPDRDRATLIDEVFGTRQRPGVLRRISNVFNNAGQAFLNLGQPQVQTAAEIDVAAFAAQHPGVPSSTVARLLIEHLGQTVERERRVIVGPGVKPARQLRDEVLSDPRTRTAIQHAASVHRLSASDAAQTARKQLDEIAADFNLFAIKLFSAGLTPVFNQIYDGIEIDLDGLEHVRDTARHRRVVIVPSHKSHVDYLVISYLFYRHGLLAPHIAAGINLSFWPLGPIFRRSGAFFLRRSFSGDPIYPVVFNAYLVKLLEEGFPIEFFIEGTRSRTGKLNPPKYGMLNMIVDAGLQGDVDDVAFVPISIAYENIIEGSSYRQELTGGEKQAENLGALLRTPAVLRSRYGRVYVEFGRAIELRSFIDSYHPGQQSGDIERPELERTVRRLAYRIIHGINDVTTVSPSALAALVLLNSPAGRVDADTLARESGFVLNYLRTRGARLSSPLREAIARSLNRIAKAESTPIDPSGFDDYEREFVEEANRHSTGAPVALSGDEETGRAVAAPLAEALRLLADKKVVERHADGWSTPDDRRIELSYYRNNIIHYFVAEAVFATALLSFAGEEAEREAVRAHAHLLSRLLKFEFCFEERRRFDAVFDESATYFAARHWIRISDDGTLFNVPADPSAGAEFFRALIIPTIETYALALTTLNEIGAESVDERALTKRALAVASSQQARGELLYRETTSRATLENAWRLLREWELLENAPHDGARAKKGGRVLRVPESARGERLAETARDIARLVRRQTRAPDAALRQF